MARLKGVDRGQVALVGAFAIAVLVVVLAIVLSSTIQVGAQAARGHGPDVTDALRFSAETERVVVDIANRREWDASTCETTVRTEIEAWGELAGRHAAADGAVLTVTVADGDVTCSGSSVTAVTYTFTYATPTLAYETTVEV